MTSCQTPKRYKQLLLIHWLCCMSRYLSFCENQMDFFSAPDFSFHGLYHLSTAQRSDGFSSCCIYFCNNCSLWPPARPLTRLLLIYLYSLIYVAVKYQVVEVMYSFYHCEWPVFKRFLFRALNNDEAGLWYCNMLCMKTLWNICNHWHGNNSVELYISVHDMLPN